MSEIISQACCRLKWLTWWRCDFVPPLTRGVWCVFTGLQRSAEAESRAEAEDEAKLGRGSRDKNRLRRIKDNKLYSRLQKVIPDACLNWHLHCSTLRWCDGACGPTAIFSFFMCCHHITMFAFAFKLMSEVNGNKICQKVVFKWTLECYFCWNIRPT